MNKALTTITIAILWTLGVLGIFIEEVFAVQLAIVGLAAVIALILNEITR